MCAPAAYRAQHKLAICKLEDAAGSVNMWLNGGAFLTVGCSPPCLLVCGGHVDAFWVNWWSAVITIHIRLMSSVVSYV